jgi:PAS domain-containing protein
MADRTAAHPVKRELWRLLGGVALCAILVLAAYLVMDGQLDRMRRTQEQFHAPALAMANELSSALASIAAPRGVSPAAVDHLEDEVAFVSSVTRDFGRAQALLASLIALHEREGTPEFEHVRSRLVRAGDELKTLERSDRGQPLELARLLALRPVYASVVVQQTQRLHEQASRLLRERQADAQRLFVGVFVVVCAALGLGLALQLRRSLRGIDGILGQERDALERVAAVLASVPDLWFVLDDKGCFREVSNAAHPDLAISWGQLQGHSFRLVPEPADPAVSRPEPVGPRAPVAVARVRGGRRHGRPARLRGARGADEQQPLAVPEPRHQRAQARRAGDGAQQGRARAAGRLAHDAADDRA